MAEGYQDNTGKVFKSEGTLPDQEGLYVVANAIPDGAIVLHAFWLTTYYQWRPMSYGYQGNALIIVDGTTSMKNRPYEVFYAFV